MANNSTAKLNKSLTAMTVINLAQVTEQELHQMVNDINRNFNILANSAIGKGPSGISPELALYDLPEDMPIYTDYDIKGASNRITQHNAYELVEWQGALEDHSYQALPVFVELFTDNASKETHHGIVEYSQSKDSTGARYLIGDLSGWLTQESLNEGDETLYKVRDAYPKLLRTATSTGDKYTWIINGQDTGINAMGYPGKDGVNASIFGSNVNPLSAQFQYIDVAKEGDICFAPGNAAALEGLGNDGTLWIWTYQMYQGSLQWRPTLNITNFFPGSFNETAWSGDINPNSVDTTYVKIAGDFDMDADETVANATKSGIDFFWTDAGAYYRIGQGQRPINLNDPDRRPLLVVGFRENQSDYEGLPGIWYDNGVNMFNTRLGDASIDFEPFTIKQLRAENSDIFSDAGTEDSIHRPFNLEMRNKNNERYLTIFDNGKERSFMRWKRIKLNKSTGNVIF